MGGIFRDSYTADFLFWSSKFGRYFDHGGSGNQRGRVVRDLGICRGVPGFEFWEQERVGGGEVKDSRRRIGCAHPENGSGPLHSSAVVLEADASEAMTVYDQSSMLLWVTDDRLAQFPTNQKLFIKDPAILSEWPMRFTCSNSPPTIRMR